MPFLIYATDFKGKEKIRERLRNDHRKHLESAGKRLLISGALLADDNITVIGGISLLDTESREEAERFAFEDPFEKAGIRERTLVVRWRKRWLVGKF